MKEFVKNLTIFVIFGTLYFIIETIWKGHLTHWSMFVLAGIIGTLIGGMNEYIPWEMPFWEQCLGGAALATLFEGCAGIVLNIVLNLHIWDYSNMPFQFFFGQCCLPFCAAWLVLAALCILIDDWVRWRFFGEEQPHYSL